MRSQFGAYLRALRLSRGLGLLRFAERAEMLAPNLSAVEHGYGTQAYPLEKLRRIAEALGLEDGSDEWERFFFLAKRPGQLPAHVQHYADMDWFALICRTLNELKPTKVELNRAVEIIKRERGPKRRNAGAGRPS